MEEVICSHIANIARGFFRDHDLIILDEPTVAIDPYEETKIYNRFAEISRDKSAVIVTHRMGSVRLADRILVVKDGEAVRLGTHQEFLIVSIMFCFFSVFAFSRTEDAFYVEHLPYRFGRHSDTL